MTTSESADDFAVGSRDGFRFGAVGDGPGSGAQTATGNSGGGSSMLDLSKTNDLLQQIVDAVRKQKDGGLSPLPNGSASVYADRL